MFSVCLSVCLTYGLSLISFCLSICPSVCLLAYFYTCLSVCFTFYFKTYTFFTNGLTVCLFVCPRLTTCPSFCLSTSSLSAYRSLYLRACLFLCLPPTLSKCLSSPHNFRAVIHLPWRAAWTKTISPLSHPSASLSYLLSLISSSLYNPAE